MDVFKNEKYRNEMISRGIRFPLEFISDNSEYKNMKLPTTFTFKTKQDL